MQLTIWLLAEEVEEHLAVAAEVVLLRRGEQ
jgi:hypothetical protein